MRVSVLLAVVVGFATVAQAQGITEQDIADIVRLHNAARAEVKGQPVTWSPQVAAFAQEWANRLAERGEFDHRESQYGENLAINETPSAAVEAWLKEKALYRQGTPVTDLNTDAVGHYTQMVWRQTTTIGCGRAVMKRGDYMGFMVLVCNYNPPGNVTGQVPF